MYRISYITVGLFSSEMQKEIMTERTIALVNEHLEKYPEMRIADVYKLLYQACMGPEHAITDHEGVEDWLLKEWDRVTANKDEDLYENITLFHHIYRLHLRPAKVNDISTSKILEAFISLGEVFPKNPELFRSIWTAVVELIKSGKITLPDSAELNEFIKLIEENDYPPMHHSKAYAEAYEPAYRLVGSDV
jgi:hypothetical protein